MPGEPVSYTAEAASEGFRYLHPHDPEREFWCPTCRVFAKSRDHLPGCPEEFQFRFLIESVTRYIPVGQDRDVEQFQQFVNGNFLWAFTLKERERMERELLYGTAGPNPHATVEGIVSGKYFET